MHDASGGYGRGAAEAALLPRIPRASPSEGQKGKATVRLPTLQARPVRPSDAERIAHVVQESENEKIGRVSTTYLATVSCVDCPLKNHGCYAEHGMVALWKRKLDAAVRARKASPVRQAQAEADGIDALRAKGQALRLHTSGDCPTTESARIVADASARFTKRGGGSVWTYTHAWRRVSRRAWGAVSVLASVEKLADARRAMSKGWAVARVVPTFASDKAWIEGGVRWIPCPAQTRDNVTCESCRLCWDDAKLREINAGVAFAAHGSARKMAAKAVS